MPPSIFLPSKLDWPPDPERLEQYSDVIDAVVPNWRRNLRRAVRRYNQGQNVDERYMELFRALWGQEFEWRDCILSLHMQGTTGGKRPWNLHVEATVYGTVPAEMSESDVVDEFGGLLEIRVVDALEYLGVSFYGAEGVFVVGAELRDMAETFRPLRGSVTMVNEQGREYNVDIEV